MLRHNLSFVLFAFLVFGCSTNNGEALNQEKDIIQQLAVMSSTQPLPVASLRALGGKAHRQRLYEPAWHVYYLLCQYEQETSEKLRVCRLLVDIASILGKEDMLFQSALVSYIHTMDKNMLLLTRKLATTEYRRGLLALSMGQIPRQIDESKLTSSTLGQLYYLRGKENNDIQALELAQAQFLQANMPLKLAETFFLKAKLYWQKNEMNDAQINAVQAALMFDSIEHTHLADGVRKWIDARINTR